MKKFFHMMRYAKPYKRMAYLNILFNFLSIISGIFSFAMLMPFLRLLFTEEVLVQKEPEFAYNFNSLYHYSLYHLTQMAGDDKKQTLLVICIVLIIFILIKNITRYFALYFLVPLRTYAVRDMRNAIYKKVMRLQLSYFSHERKGDIISRMSNDVNEMEWAIMTSLEAVFKEPFTIIVTLAFLIFISPLLTLMVFVLLPLTAIIITTIGKKLKNISSRNQERLGGLMSLFEESLSGIRIIKGFNRESFFYRRFLKENGLLASMSIAVNRQRDASSPLSEVLGTAVLCVLLYIGGNMVFDGQGSLEGEVFIGYIILFSQIIPPAKAFSNAFYNVQKGAASAERIEEILNVPETVIENPGAEKITTFRSNIQFHEVGFAYEKEDVLKKISFEVKKGQTIALVGPSGSGKSTLADLLVRFYDTTSGFISIDGKDIRQYKIADLRSLMGIVSQESILFNDSVYNNIAFGNHEVTKEQVINAAKVANAHEFIVQMDKGYYTNIGDRGNKLSGGQKQRIAIARAVLKNPEILILDEATSALDTTSERLVQDALNNLMQNRTSLVIAHRLSTIQKADQIIVLEKGELKQRGTHAELINAQGLYKELNEMQQLGI